MTIRWLDKAKAEMLALPAHEQEALGHAADKLGLLGERLGFPHTSAVKGARPPLRELRPRGGRSRWRGFYQRMGDAMVLASVGPEAEVDPRGFARAVRLALERLADEEERGE